MVPGRSTASADNASSHARRKITTRLSIAGPSYRPGHGWIWDLGLTSSAPVPEGKIKRDCAEERALAPFDDLLQDRQPFRLPRPHAAPRFDPPPLAFRVAVDDLDVVVGGRVMKCRARVLGQELKKSFPPRVPGRRKETFGERLQFLHADSANGYSD